MRRLPPDRHPGFWRFRPARPTLLPALLLGVAAGWLVPAGSARAQARPAEAPARAGFDIPPGALEDSLSTFARQAGITLSFDPALVRGKSAGPIQGSRTVPEGLAELLSPHRLEAVPGTSGAYAVRPAAAASAAVSGTGAALPTVTVTTAGERADGQVDGYVARRSATATRIDTPLLETPRAVTVITRAQMDDQAVHTVEQSLRYSAGVLTEVSGYDTRFASLTVRGFAPAEYLDGFKLPTNSFATRWLVEPQALERVELLKGPGAVYDPSAPGGAINMVSKRPSAEAVREVSLSVGNSNRRQASFDIGGAMNADGSLLFRLNGVLRNSDGQTDYSRDDRSFIAPSLTWTLSPRTKVTLMAEATRDRTTPKSIWPQGALITPNPWGSIPRERYTGEPGFDHYNRDAFSLTYLFEHQLDDNWTLRQNARHAKLDIDYRQVYGSSFQSDQRTLDRQVMRASERNRSTTLDTQVEGRFSTGPVSHTLLMGMEYQRQTSSQQNGIGPAPSIDAFAPVYGQPVSDPPLNGLNDNSITQRGFYVQDQMRNGPWSLGLTVRQDRARSSVSRLVAQSFGIDTNAKTTYNAGLLYLAPNGQAPYFSYSTSFTPLSGAIAGGTLLKPELGRQFEAGLKYRPPGVDALFTVSVFDLRKNNSPTFDPYVIGPVSQIGEVRTRGPEFEARAAITKQLKLVASYTLLDAKVTRSLNPAEVGRQPLNTARQTAALWLDYRFGSPALQGWSIGGGVRHVGKVPANTDNSLYNPPYTLLDAALRYERGPYSFALNATNLTDRNYVAGNGQYFGQGRAVQAKFAYRW
ncbi:MULTISPECIES: TonB-dependent siderophore receptor [unclassified Variovorax]|uniref:TonB-dependent siderophore receptor n=1 Tax=unclassified Variovorax TaxID=663243 RepID=UPI000F7E505B|nr:MULTISPECIES: TonB-dependent siderophore receptor [unclassified Variovorax]RSZ42730.1 TonB-dependent siderophore receptor [Variovorax sp. 553]RSZ43704.1 TonB-dependent siderophore receptor [Variovorax sp. 679]